MKQTKKNCLNVLLNYADIFAVDKNDIGRTDKVQHQIDTGGAPPVRQQVRRVPPALRGELKSILGDMLQNDIIHPTNSPWASPVVLVRKKDGSLRFCVDY